MGGQRSGGELVFVSCAVRRRRLNKVLQLFATSHNECAKLLGIHGQSAAIRHRIILQLIHRRDESMLLLLLPVRPFVFEEPAPEPYEPPHLFFHPALIHEEHLQ